MPILVVVIIRRGEERAGERTRARAREGRARGKREGQGREGGRRVSRRRKRSGWRWLQVAISDGLWAGPKNSGRIVVTMASARMSAGNAGGQAFARWVGG